MLISIFEEGVTNTIPSDSFTLENVSEYLISDKAKNATQQLRDETDSEKRKQIKRTQFKIATFSGTFEKRKREHIISFSHLICLDIDNVQDTTGLKHQLTSLSEFQPALVFVSPSGTGIKTVYKTENITAEHVPAAYTYIADRVEDKLGCAVDRAPKSVVSACFLPWDPNAYINKDAVPVNIPAGAFKNGKSTSYSSDDNHQTDLKKAQACVQYIKENQINIADDYKEWINIGLALSELGEGGRELFHSVSSISPKYQEDECNTTFTHLLKNRTGDIQLGTFFELCKQYNVPLSEIWKDFRQTLNLAKIVPLFWDEETKSTHRKREQHLLENKDHPIVHKIAENYGIPHEVLCEYRVGLGQIETVDGAFEEAVFVPYQYGCRAYFFDDDILRSKDLPKSRPLNSFFGLGIVLDRKEVAITENPFDAMFLSSIRSDLDVISVIDPENNLLSEKQGEQLKLKSDFWSTFYICKNSVTGGEKKEGLSFCRQFADLLPNECETYWVNVESQYDAFFQIIKKESSDSTDIFEKGMYVWNSLTEKNRFWYTTDTKKPKLAIDELRLSEVLNNAGFKKIYLGKSDTPSVLFLNNNVVNELSNHKIMDYIRDHILPKLSKYVAEFILDGKTKLKSKRDLSKIFLSYRRQLLNENVKAIFSTSNINFLADDIDTVHLFYQNSAVKVQKDTYKLINYSDLPGKIWFEQVLDREFSENALDDRKSQFEQFLENVSNGKPERMKAFRTTLGYLLSSYKNVADTRAVILTDENIAPPGQAEGGTGKSIFGSALKFIRKQRYIAGKNVDLNSRFAFMDTKSGDQILFFDDVKKEFDFEALFNVITNDMQVEAKYENRFTIPFEKSPKILIATNEIVRGTGNSYRRRQAILEFSDHYLKNKSVEQEFGGRFYHDWDEAEWCRFDKFMIKCIQEYLIYGISDYTSIAYNSRKIRHQTSASFFDWAEVNLETDVEYSANILFSGQDREANPNEPLKKKPKNSTGNVFDPYLWNSSDLDEKQMKTFKKWLKFYADHRSWELQDRPRNGYSIITFAEN